MKSMMLLLVLVLFCSVASADWVKGSAGAKRYTFVPDTLGHSQFQLIFDNFNADLDLGLFLIADGEPLLIGSDLSTARRYCKMEAGTNSALVYGVIVNAYRGSSPFRMIVTSSGDEFLLPSLVTPQLRRTGLIEHKEWDTPARKALGLLREVGRRLKQ